MDFQTICRVCTLENLEMVSIFESHNFSAHNYEISKIITDCASVQIQKLDGFSQQICRRCLDHLSQAYSFKRLCENSDYKFRNDLIVSTKMEIKDEFSAEDTKIIFGDMDNYCINENTDETIKITHIGLTQFQKEQCNDISNREIKSDKNQCEEEKEELDSTSAFSGLLESKGCQAPSGVKYAQPTNDTSEPSNNVIETNNHPDNQSETEGEELPVASFSSDVIESIDSEESPTLKNSRCTRSKVEIKDEFSAEDTKIIFGETDNYCITENIDETIKITHIGLTQVQKEQCSDVSNIEIKSDKNQCEEEKEELDSTSACSGLLESKGCQTPSGVKYAHHTNSDTSEPSNDVIETNNHSNNQSETEEEQQPLASLSNDVLESKNSEESPILKNSRCTRSKISLAKSSKKLKSGSPHKCEFCNKSFAYKKGILRHIRLLHPERSKISLAKSSKKLQSGSPHKCEFCNKSFGSWKSLLHHMKLVHPERDPYKCSVCSKEFRKRTLMTQHMKMHKEERPFVCHVCDKRYVQKQNLVDHLELHTRQEMYQCDICGNKILHKSGLIKHIRAHTEGINRRKCNICGRLLKSSLKLHMESHTAEKPFKCNICDKTFKRNGTLKSHIRKHIGEQPYECDICGKKFLEKRHLRCHIEKHIGKKTFECDICDKIFSARATLTVHIREHTSEVYKCDFCGKKFLTNKALKAHVRTHTGEKPYKCEFCDRTFAQPYTLKVHIRTHTGEKPFKCHLCDKQFAVPETLKNHIRTHTGEKPFKCDFCDKKFTSRTLVKRHITKLHPRQ